MSVGIVTKHMRPVNLLANQRLAEASISGILGHRPRYLTSLCLDANFSETFYGVIVNFYNAYCKTEE